MSEETEALDKLRKTDEDLFEQIRHHSFRRALKMLKDPKVDIPPGQLLAFVSKVGDDFGGKEVSDKPQIKQQNIFAILPGLPPERQEQILSQFEKELTKARKELTSGGP